MTDANATSAPSTTTRSQSIRELSAPRRIENPFDTAPLYRKRWMIVVSALVFIPAAVLILLTGPVFQNDGEVWDQKTRKITAAALCVFMAMTFLRLSVQPG